ncbi:MAG TPA: T9SS type A sorting domain-containing protein [Pricia antarctica]|uniref:T9SS type A sorting domain-containing protein n=1 Tax=Pricia antarctica TaxID=641691 RepID=A0A831VP34_9FLAO|nr:T9SS type A sorting domain-containing protein [Pricia antarctica]
MVGNKFLIIGTFLYCCSFTSFSQSIRKGFDEMTDQEISGLVSAFYDLRNGPDIFNDMATYHANFFNFDNTADPTRQDLHFNLPEEAEREIFLAWHRMMIFEMEQAVQEINPKLSLGFWDNSIYQSSGDELWAQNFLGSFDTNWTLNRNFGQGGPLPTPNQISDLMNMNDFFDFSNELERRPVHRGAHVWTGGAMPTPLSPRDPAFFFHHVFVDKVWHDWEEIHQSSSFIATSLLRYDGTYIFDGEVLPAVDPNDIKDSRVLGVFYGENGLAQLDNYIVSNTYNPEEIFYYQYTIEAGNNFIVPPGAVASIESVNEVNLVPGFEAAAGSSFRASIDTQILPIFAPSFQFSQRQTKPYPYSDKLFEAIVWEEGGDLLNDEPIIISASPNPFRDTITIKLSEKKDCVVEVFNQMGMPVKQENFQNTDTLVIKDLYGLTSGLYVIRVSDANGNLLVVKRVVKL